MAAIPSFVVQPVFNTVQPVLGAFVHGTLVKAREKHLGRLIFAGAGVAQNNVNAPIQGGKPITMHL